MTPSVEFPQPQKEVTDFFEKMLSDSSLECITAMRIHLVKI
jgi:hypothetical protein